MYTIERNVGRLLEVRQIAATPAKLEEILQFREDLLTRINAARESLVICVDLRRATLYAPPVAEQMSSMMKVVNTKLERSAIVVPDDRATFWLQLERLIRNGGAASRRTFRAPDRAAEWLDEVLGEDERTRLRVFLLQ